MCGRERKKRVCDYMSMLRREGGQSGTRLLQQSPHLPANTCRRRDVFGLFRTLPNVPPLRCPLITECQENERHHA